MQRHPLHNDLATTLRVLARLLEYPGRELRGHLPECARRCTARAPSAASGWHELDALVDGLLAQGPMDAEADYVQLFDCGRATSLHLFEHVHGDSRDRGPAMIDLAKTYEAAGLYLAEGELPDYLPVVLQFASTQPRPRPAPSWPRWPTSSTPSSTPCKSANSLYASVLGALIEMAGDTTARYRSAARSPAGRKLGRAAGL
jgi:nitrate reductase delta subunit